MEERAEKLIALLGLARRAGKLAMGHSAVAQQVRRGERPLVVVATDAGPGLRSRVARWTPVRGIVDDVLTAADLARALGREKLVVVGLSDSGFIAGIGKIGL